MEEVLPQSTSFHAEVLKCTTRNDAGSPPPNPLDLLKKERENPNIFQEREDRRLQAEDEVQCNDAELTNKQGCERYFQKVSKDEFVPQS